MISNQSFMPQSAVIPEYYQQQMQASPNQANWGPQMQASPNQANWRPQMQLSPNQANWGPQAVQEQHALPSYHSSVDLSQMHHIPYMYDFHHMHHYHPMMDDYHPMMDDYHPMMHGHHPMMDDFDPMMHEMWDEHMFLDHHHDGWEFEALDYHHAWFYPMMHVHHHLHYTGKTDELQKKAAVHQP